MDLSYLVKDKKIVVHEEEVLNSKRLKRREGKGKQIVFDERSRKEFITGFNKRKKIRQERAKKEKATEHKQAVQQWRRSKESQFAAEFPEINEKFQKMLKKGRKKYEKLPSEHKTFKSKDMVITTRVTPLFKKRNLEESDEESDTNEHQDPADDGFGFGFEVAPKATEKEARTEEDDKPIFFPQALQKFRPVQKRTNFKRNKFKYIGKNKLKRRKK